MKTNKPLWKLLCFLLLIQGSLHAQDPIAVCAANQREAQEMLSQQVLSVQDKATIYNLVKPCADQGDIDAICNMGILYKDGIGVTQDFDKSFEYFKKSADLGHEKAKYALGYFYLKGLGSTEQDYEKAVAYFDESLDKMAKYWLGYCQYFGYGMPKDQVKATALLYKNTLLNSRTLVEQFEAELEPISGTPTSQFNDVPENLKPITNYNQLQATIGNSQLLPPAESGTYAGNFVEYDWSGEQVIRHIPFELDAEVVDDFGYMDIVLHVGEYDIEGTARWDSGVLYFNDFTFELPRLYTDNPAHTTLAYELRKITFQPVPFDGINYLVGTMDATITNWKEPANPMLLILNQTGGGVDVEGVLKSQTEAIKLFPNPFDDHINFGVALTNPDLNRVQLVIAPLGPGRAEFVLNGNVVNDGTDFLTIRHDTSHLPSGMYIVYQIVAGVNAGYGRTIIKQ